MAQEKYLNFARHHSPVEGYPRAVNDANEWVQVPLNWTSGFLPGILWNLAHWLEHDELQQQARRWTVNLDDAAHWSTHDIGFMVDYSFGKGYRATNETQYLPVMEQGAKNLVTRFNPNVGAIKSWNRMGRHTVIIDNLMNLALLFEAARLFADDRYYQIALTHAYTTADEFIRQDGSTFHVVDFDPTSGAVMRKHTEQGLNASSTWARGQAWAIYGFAQTYGYTGDVSFLEAADVTAKAFISRMPNDGVAPWDFDAPGEAQKDAAASAIAAAGLWLLSNLHDNPDTISVYRKASQRLIDALLNPRYIDLNESGESLLMHATGHFPAGSEIDTSLIYADYYLIEAMMMQLGFIDSPL
ncbi:glycoside hydrolase family 88 protein [Saliniradius amylolyticus]|nr:glycoside hydrolase family 88 protein [Saliniradius amylolyticus]